MVMTGNGKEFYLNEVDSIYVGEKDRFVVSLVVGYGAPGETHKGFPRTPKQAAAAALALTTEIGSHDTLWHVYDRKTGQMHKLEQQEFYEIRVP